MCGHAQMAVNETRINEEIVSSEKDMSRYYQEIKALFPLDVHDGIDQQNFISEKNEIFEKISRCKKKLRELEEARTRLYNKTYGLCSCGRKIEAERLKAHPEAKYCEVCAPSHKNDMFS